VLIEGGLIAVLGNRDLQGTGKKLLDKLNGAQFGLVHVNNHPWMINLI
jgi:hypothetical protein